MVIEHHAIKFNNAQELAAQHPDTFQVWNLDILKKTVQPGVFIKVSARDERFWAKVVKISDFLIFAEVANHLVTCPMNFGDTIVVSFENIYDIAHHSEAAEDEAEAQVEMVCPDCN